MSAISYKLSILKDIFDKVTPWMRPSKFMISNLGRRRKRRDLNPDSRRGR